MMSMFNPASQANSFLCWPPEPGTPGGRCHPGHPGASPWGFGWPFSGPWSSLARARLVPDIPCAPRCARQGLVPSSGPGGRSGPPHSWGIGPPSGGRTRPHELCWGGGERGFARPRSPKPWALALCPPLLWRLIPLPASNQGGPPWGHPSRGIENPVPPSIPRDSGATQRCLWPSWP